MVIPVGECSVESGRRNDGALWRRRDDAHGNDVLERFIHAHVEFDDVLLRHHQEETGGRVGRGRYVDTDVLALQVGDHIAERMHVHIGIITVPEEAAHAVADRLVAAGILAIWNFAPVRLNVPANVIVHNEDLYVSLATLSQKLEVVLRRDAQLQRGGQQGPQHGTHESRTE